MKKEAMMMEMKSIGISEHYGFISARSPRPHSSNVFECLLVSLKFEMRREILRQLVIIDLQVDMFHEGSSAPRMTKTVPEFIQRWRNFVVAPQANRVLR